MKIIYRKLGRHRMNGQQVNGLAYQDVDLIEIDIRLKGCEQLEIIIHEILHIQNKDWEENKVAKHAREMSKLLWEQGFRKVDL